LYAAVLGRSQVGVCDSFFDIGGSSLQVMRLVDMISKELGVDVGVSVIFLHPSPRQLAASIELIRSGAGQSGGAGPMVQLTSGVGELPLFLIHAVGGTVFAYAQLASELAGTFRVYGLEAPGLSQAAATASSLSGLVDDYTQRIRAAQPTGPYRLAGWSMGGVVAFEIARQLEQAGQQVSLLALLDAPFAQPDTGVFTESQLAGQFLADATHSLGWGAAAGLPDPATSNAAEQLAWLAGRLAGGGDDGADSDGADSTESADREAVAAQLQRRFDVFQAHIRMLSGYQPEAPAVRAPTLIVSADDSPNAPCRAHWPRVLDGPVTTQCVDSDHYTFLRPPLVAEVGTSILKWHDG
jgi:thioesterase domain-containing protein